MHSGGAPRRRSRFIYNSPGTNQKKKPNAAPTKDSSGALDLSGVRGSRSQRTFHCVRHQVSGTPSHSHSLSDKTP
jgi:hypothetical protein